MDTHEAFSGEQTRVVVGDTQGPGAGGSVSWGAGATPGERAARGEAGGPGGTWPDTVVPGMVSRRFCVEINRRLPESC